MVVLIRKWQINIISHDYYQLNVDMIQWRLQGGQRAEAPWQIMTPIWLIAVNMLKLFYVEFIDFSAMYALKKFCIWLYKMLWQRPLTWALSLAPLGDSHPPDPQAIHARTSTHSFAPNCGSLQTPLIWSKYWQYSYDMLIAFSTSFSLIAFILCCRQAGFVKLLSIGFCYAFYCIS